MSNRPKLKPPASVRAMARSYKCGHCDSETGQPRFDGVIWHIDIHHDDECPVLNGHIPVAYAGGRAAQAAASETGKRILYISPDDQP